MNIKGKIEYHKFKKEWHRRNKHNGTVANSIFPIKAVLVGKHTYGGLNVLAFNEINQLTIGHYVSIGPETIFILSADHFQKHISTYPFKSKLVSGEFEGVSKGNISVGDDVWIGYKSTILSGVSIGQGAIVAAGSVVTKDVEPYSIVGGNPAKIIKKRFSQDIINYLLTLDYSKLDDSMVKKHIEELYRDIDNLEINKLKEIYVWFAKKDCM